MDEENNIDKLFKSGLNDPEIPFNELDWENMSRILDVQQKKRGIPLRLFTASGIAAVLVIILFWFALEPAVMQKKVDKNSVVKHEDKGENRPADQREQKLVPTLPKADHGMLQDGPLRIAGSRTVKLSDAQVIGTAAPFVTGKLVSGPEKEQQIISSSPPASQTNIIDASPKVSALKPALPATAAEVLAQKANALAKSKDVYGKITAEEISRNVKKGMEKAMVQGHQLVLTAMAAPDISTAGNSKSSRVSSNLGMLATYALGNRFSVTSGAIYAKKYYNSGGTAASDIYATTTATEWEVKADCNVLDIPLNVNYKLVNKKGLSVSVNTGLSSYFMLKEKYQYITSPGAPSQQVSNTEFDNQNKHLFGIANVSVSFDHQISQNLSVGVQPFAKLPLTGIGNNNVDLKSTGVSFSISIGLFHTTKPGKMASNRYPSSNSPSF